MKTELQKRFNWGFVLSEQEFRRIIKTCQDHYEKATLAEGSTKRILLAAKLNDGSIVESNNVEDIVSLENSGSKQVERVTLLFDDGKEPSDWSISVEFQDGYKNINNWTSVDFTI